MKSIITYNQKKSFEKHIYINKEPVILICHIRYNDECKNGHNTFSITLDMYEKYKIPYEGYRLHNKSKIKCYLSSWGCLHDLVIKYFPDFKHLIKWHLCSTDGPMYYIENSQ